MSRTRNLSKLAKNTTTTGTLTQEAGGGGGSFADTDNVIMKNSKTISSNVTVEENKGLTSTGPITIAAGVTVSIPATSRWVIL